MGGQIWSEVYELQVALARKDTELEELREALETCSEALYRHEITWVAQAPPSFQEPYTDDPRWTPWDRWVEPVLRRGDEAQKAARAALASTPEES